MLANTKKYFLSLSYQIILIFSKSVRCPECRSPIEKNGGCMHMTCKKNAGRCLLDRISLTFLLLKADVGMNSAGYVEGLGLNMVLQQEDIITATSIPNQR
jgi:hypothetical protein